MTTKAIRNCRLMLEKGNYNQTHLEPKKLQAHVEMLVSRREDILNRIDQLFIKAFPKDKDTIKELTVATKLKLLDKADKMNMLDDYKMQGEV